MADQDEIAITIRSILTAFKHGCPINVLTREYFEACGQPLPYKRFGYANATELLQVMPKVARFGINKIGENVFFAVATEDTEHVASLVRRQKSAPLKPSTASRSNFNRSSYGDGRNQPSYSQPKRATPSNGRGRGHSGGGGHIGGYFSSKSWTTPTNGFNASLSNDIRNKFEDNSAVDRWSSNFSVKSSTVTTNGSDQAGNFASAKPSSTITNGFGANTSTNDAGYKTENYSGDWNRIGEFSTQTVKNGFNVGGDSSSYDVVKIKVVENVKSFNEPQTPIRSNAAKFLMTPSSTPHSNNTSFDGGFSSSSSSSSNFQQIRQNKMSKCVTGGGAIPEHMLFKTIIPVSFKKQIEYDSEISDLVNRNMRMTPSKR